MTATVDVETAPSSLRVTTPRDVWRRARLPLALGVVFVLLAIARAISLGGVGADRLDPTAAGPEGGRALATLLRNHGVDVRRVEAPSGTSGVTVFIPVPELLATTSPSAFAIAADAAYLVVVAPGNDVLDALRLDVRVKGDTEVRAVDPACTQPDAHAAGDVRLGGKTYTAPEDTLGCYARGGDPSFVETAGGPRRITVLGSGDFMTNDHLDERGDAALALRILMRQPVVEWVYPTSFAADEGGGQGLGELLPHRVFVLVAELLVVVLLVALWRARRLGPVVAEPLPVVVRAAEAVEGRARLYEAAGSRERAAYALRAGRRDRLTHVLGLAPDAPPETLVAAVASRTTRDAITVGDLLYGPPPPDDAALVRLADELDRLDSEVRAL